MAISLRSADAHRCLSESGAAAVMVGRCAVGRPWLVGQIGAALQGRTVADPTPEAMTAIAVGITRALIDLYGEQVAIRHARKHLAAYADVAIADGFAFAVAARKTLVTTNEPEFVLDLLRSLYCRSGCGRPHDDRRQRPDDECPAAARV